MAPTAFVASSALSVHTQTKSVLPQMQSLGRSFRTITTNRNSSRSRLMVMKDSSSPSSSSSSAPDNQNQNQNQNDNNEDQTQDKDQVPNPQDMAQIPQSEIDWTSEWQRFQTTGMKTQAGRGITPQPKAVIQAKKSMRSIAQGTQKVSASLPRMSWRQLSKDWRFWVAVIVMLSITTSIITSSAQSSYSGGAI